MKINEKCRCGATIHVDGQPALCQEMHINFLKAHEKCKYIDTRLAKASMAYEDETHVIHVHKKLFKDLKGDSQ